MRESIDSALDLYKRLLNTTRKDDQSHQSRVVLLDQIQAHVALVGAAGGRYKSIVHAMFEIDRRHSHFDKFQLDQSSSTILTHSLDSMQYVIAPSALVL